MCKNMKPEFLVSPKDFGLTAVDKSPNRLILSENKTLSNTEHSVISFNV